MNNLSSVFWTDHGTNSVWRDSMEFDVNWTTTASTLVAKTANQPTALLIEPFSRMLYWAEPDGQSVIAYSLNMEMIFRNFTYRLDPESDPSRLNSKQ